MYRLSLWLEDTKEKVMSGNGVVESRSQWIEWVEHKWPDKRAVTEMLADSAEDFSRKCPACGNGVYARLLAQLGYEVAQAKNPSQCVEAYFEVIKYFACPEPGWDSIELKFVA